VKNVLGRKTRLNGQLFIFSEGTQLDFADGG